MKKVQPKGRKSGHGQVQQRAGLQMAMDIE